jgi:hypothetical protein
MAVGNVPLPPQVPLGLGRATRRSRLGPLFPWRLSLLPYAVRRRRQPSWAFTLALSLGLALGLGLGAEGMWLQAQAHTLLGQEAFLQAQERLYASRASLAAKLRAQVATLQAQWSLPGSPTSAGRTVGDLLALAPKGVHVESFTWQGGHLTLSYVATGWDAGLAYAHRLQGALGQVTIASIQGPPPLRFTVTGAGGATG